MNEDKATTGTATPVIPVPFAPVPFAPVRTWAKEYAAAFVSAQGEMKSPHRNREVTVATKSGGQYKFTYATLDSILDEVRPVLSKHGLAVTWKVAPATVTTRVMHLSGQYDEVTTELILGKDCSMQDYGGALTYSKRYGLTTILGISADEDDDANGASGNTAEGKDRTPSNGATANRQAAATGAKSDASAPTGSNSGVSEARMRLKNVTKEQLTSKRTGKPFDKFHILGEDGRAFETIEQGIAKRAHEAMKSGDVVLVTFAPNQYTKGKTFDLVNVSPIPKDEQPAPADEDGRADEAFAKANAEAERVAREMGGTVVKAATGDDNIPF